MKLEFVDALTLAHPFIKGFEQISYCLNDEEVRAVASGDIPDVVARRKKEDVEGKEGASTVYTSTFFIGLLVEKEERKQGAPPFAPSQVQCRFVFISSLCIIKPVSLARES